MKLTQIKVNCSMCKDKSRDDRLIKVSDSQKVCRICLSKIVGWEIYDAFLKTYGVEAAERYANEATWLFFDRYPLAYKSGWDLNFDFEAFCDEFFDHEEGIPSSLCCFGVL